MTAPRIPISDLTAAGALADADLVPVVQSGTTKKATMADFVTKARIPQGLLSARPSAASVGNGDAYFATDDNGGTLYIEVSNAWVEVASVGDNAAGTILGRAAPTSSAAFTIAASPGNRCTELTTTSFTMPSNACTVYVSPIAIASVSVAGTVWSVRYTTDAWATNKLVGAQAEIAFASNTSTFMGSVLPLRDGATGSAPSAGSTVSVAVFIGHPSDTSVQLNALAVFGQSALIEVRAG